MPNILASVSFGQLIVFWVVGGFIFGVMMGMIAENLRNRPTAGFWLGFLLGPLAILVILIMKDDRPKAADRRADLR